VGQALVLSLYLDSAEHGIPVPAQVTRVETHEQSVWKYRVAVRFSEALSEELVAHLATRARARRERDDDDGDDDGDT
jgi:hypothetical protein